MLDHPEHASNDHEYESPVNLADFVHTLGHYWRVIFAIVGTVGLLYAIIAAVVYLRSPSQKLTYQQFRLDFDRANLGEYPNGSKFSTAEVVSTPILRAVYDQNQLSRFIPYPTFAEKVFVLESNAAFERLASEYGARLADPKLSPVDRERIQTEFEGKRRSLPKNQFAIHFLRGPDDDAVPDALVRKTLEDILRLWAERAVKEQHVLSYRTAVLSPNVISADKGEIREPLVALQVLRSQIQEVLTNMGRMEQIPGAELADTKDGVSLAEIRISLEELVRYRLEPLVARVDGVGNREAAIDFISEQIAYDQRELAALDEYIAAARTALTLHSGYSGTSDAGAIAGQPQQRPAPSPSIPSPNGASETVMPQISDGFIDRLFLMTKTIADSEYRQKAISDMRLAVDKRIPIQQDLEYHRHVLEHLRTGRGTVQDPAVVNAEVKRLSDDTRRLVVAVNEIYTKLSANLSPSTHLYTLTAPGLTRTEKTMSLFRLALWGMVILLMTLPLAIVGSLLHARIRREEHEHALLRRRPATT